MGMPKMANALVRSYRELDQKGDATPPHFNADYGDFKIT